MIGDYLNQTATLHTPATLSADGSRTFTDSTIRCRFQPYNRLYYTNRGEQVASDARIFTTTLVTTGCEITFDGQRWPVGAVAKRFDLAGNISHYEVLL